MNAAEKALSPAAAEYLRFARSHGRRGFGRTEFNCTERVAREFQALDSVQVAKIGYISRFRLV